MESIELYRLYMLGSDAKHNRTFNDKGFEAMNRNHLYLIIGVLVIATLVVGYQLYQERQKTTGIEINIGERGISIEKK